jgi:ferredoxin
MLDEPVPVPGSVEVDRDVCVGSGYCQRIAPAVFDLDQTGLAVVLAARPTGSELAAAHEAERSCPSLAIAVRVS